MPIGRVFRLVRSRAAHHVRRHQPDGKSHTRLQIIRSHQCHAFFSRLLVQVNPIILIDKLSKMANAVSILKQEYDQLVTEETELRQELDGSAAELEERTRSTLNYLLRKQK